jgi:hypothetical protein
VRKERRPIDHPEVVKIWLFRPAQRSWLIVLGCPQHAVGCTKIS